MKWTKGNINRLIKLHKSGLRTKEIAAKLNRTVGSVSAKINTLQQRGELPYKHKGKKSVKDVSKDSNGRPHTKKKIKLTVKDDKYLSQIPKEVSDYTKKLFSQYENNPAFLKQMGMPIKNTHPNATPSAKKICGIIDECEKLLLAKNKAYGDSALEPIRIFSKADGQEQLKVRIDDKLNRLIQGDNSIESDRDVIMDLVGYLVLLLVAMDDTKQ